MNIIYNKKKSQKARFVDGLHKMILTQMAKDKTNQDDVDAFKLKIKQTDGKLNLADLRKLNSVYKREYVEMVIDEDKAI
jgi:hypothetical protein